jgi:hypothetical protein
VSVARACRGKKAHPNEAQAERHRQRLIGHGAHPGALENYECKHCPFWHVGHALRTRKRRAR